MTDPTVMLSPVTVPCPSTVHDLDHADGDPWPPAAAEVPGTFRAPWWDDGRTERITYCRRCADALVSVHYFTPDPEPAVP